MQGTKEVGVGGLVVDLIFNQPHEEPTLKGTSLSEEIDGLSIA